MFSSHLDLFNEKSFWNVSIFQNFRSEMKNQFNTSIKILRTDKPKEFFGSYFSNFMSQYSIVHQSSCSFIPQQNGVVEYKNWLLLEVARILLIHMWVPKHFEEMSFLPHVIWLLAWSHLFWTIKFHTQFYIYILICFLYPEKGLDLYVLCIIGLIELS